MIVLTVACGVYSTSTQVAPHLKTVFVPTFENETSEFYLPQILTDKMTEKILNESNLRVAATADADALLRGTILGYRVEALSYQNDESVTSRRVRVLVKAEFVDQVKGKTIWETERMERWGTYDTATEIERHGATRAVEKLAEDIVTQSLQGW